MTDAFDEKAGREADRMGSGGSSPSQGCGGEAPALRSKIHETSSVDAEILVFPHARRVKRVRHIARQLLANPGLKGREIWKYDIRGHRELLQKLGVSKDVIDRELWSYFAAVQSEMVRTACTTGSEPGGAA